MKFLKVSGLIFAGVSVVAVILYFFMSVNNNDRSSQATPLKSQDTNLNTAVGSNSLSPLINAKQALVVAESDPNINSNGMSSGAALNILNNILDATVIAGSIRVSEERELLLYLRENDDQVIYQLIVDKLHSVEPGSIDSERLFEYALSFLAAVNSQKASELFYSLIVENDISGSSAIYSANKSIERLSRNPEYTQLAQDAFSSSGDENLYLAELAKPVAINAEVENVEFLLSFVKADNIEKKYAAQAAMKHLKKESLVPLLQDKLTKDNGSNVQNASLDALANMGQYEAGVALLKWSAQQPTEALEKVTELFNVAIERSPSTERAIVKEINYIDFVSQDIKQKIIQLAELKKPI